MSEKGIISMGTRHVKDGLYDLSCKMSRTKKAKEGYSKRKKRSDMIFYCVMLAFPLTQFCLMYLGVNFNSVLLAFKQYTADFSSYTWTLANFKRVIGELMGSNQIQLAFRNSIILWFCTTIITFPTSLFISYYLYRNYRFAKGIKLTLFLPSVISGPVTAVTVYQLMDRGYPLLMKQLFGKDVLGLLANPDTQLIAYLSYTIFFSLAGSFIFLSSAMSGIDESVSEAARIDGASAMQEFRYVTLPVIYPTVAIFMVTSIISIFTSDFGLYSFYKVAGMSQIDTIGFYFVRGLTELGESQWSYFSAFGLVLTVMTAAIVFPARAFINSKDPMVDRDELRAAKRRKKERRKQK